jgi:putative peptidoglycan lipid II flippase
VIADQPRTLFRLAGIVSAFLVLSRLSGYVREALLAARFGATHTTDAWVLAQNLPASIFAVIGAGLVMVFLPVFREVFEKRGEEAAWRLTNTVLNVTMVLAALLVLVGWLVAPTLIPMLAPGLPAAPQALAVSLTRTMLPMMLFMGISGVAAAVLNANRLFFAPALVGLMSNVAVITALMLIVSPAQISWVAWAVVAGAAAGSLVQLPQLPGLGFRYSLQWELKDSAIPQIGRLILPIIATTSAIHLQGFVDLFLASGLAEGSISALNYAVRVNSLPYGVIGAAIATVLYPSLADHAASGRTDELRQTASRGLRTLAFLLLPMALGVMVFRGPLVQLIFERGAFDPQATVATAYALLFYAAGILFFGWMDFLNRCFFAIQDTLTPMLGALGMVVLNIGFNLALVGPLAHGGLALGTSLATMVGVGFLYRRLTRRLGDIGGRTLLRSVLLSLGTAMAGTLVGYLTYSLLSSLLPGSSAMLPIIRLGAGLGMIVLVHVALSVRFGSSEAVEVTARLRRRRGTP